MKVNIKKMAAGASLVYEPLPSFQSAAPPAPVPTQDPDDVESLLKGMSGKLLTNDGKYLNSKITEAVKFLRTAPRSIRESSLGKVMISEAKGNWDEINGADRSAKKFDAIMADKKNAMAEFGVDQGSILATDRATGDIAEMSITEYAQNKNKYKALTNAELMDLRETDPRFTGKDKVFSFVQGAVTTDQVTEKIRKALADISSTTKGTTETSYTQQAAEGAKAILTSSSSSTGELFETNGAQLKAAGNAMWSMLDDPSKDLLRLKAVHAGYAPEQLEGAAMGYALGLLRQKEQTKLITKDAETLGRDSKTGAGAGTSTKTGEENWFMGVANFNGAKEQFNLITGKLDSTRDAKADADSFNFGIMKDEDGKGITLATLADSRMSGLRGIVDFDQVSFGDQRIPLEKLAGIVYEGANVRAMLLPFKKEKDGGIVPDFNKAQNYTDAVKEIKKLGKYITPDDKITIYNSHGFYDLDPTGDPTAEVLRPFVVMEGITNNGIVHDSDLVDLKNDSDLEDYFKNLYKTKNDKEVSKMPSPGMFSNTKVVRGNIFIPMQNGAAKKAMFSGHTKVLVDQSENMSSSFNTTEPGNNYASPDYRQTRKVDLSVNALK